LAVLTIAVIAEVQLTIVGINGFDLSLGTDDHADDFALSDHQIDN